MKSEQIISEVMGKFDSFGFRSHQYPNAIGMWPEEQTSLVYACTQVNPDKDWIEIGSFMGGSAVLMCLTKRIIGGAGQVISVDIDFSAFQGAFNRNVYRVGKFQDIHHKLEMSSFDLAEMWRDKKDSYIPRIPPDFSLAFIDGWHSFKGVLTDFAAVDEYMVSGGIVLFHDTFPQPYPEGKLLEFLGNISPELWAEELPGNNKFSSQQEYYQAEKKQNFRIDEAIAWILDNKEYELLNLPTINGQTHFDRVKEYTHGTTSPYPGIVAIRKL